MFVFAFEGALLAFIVSGDRFALLALLPRRKPRTDGTLQPPSWLLCFYSKDLNPHQQPLLSLHGVIATGHRIFLPLTHGSSTGAFTLFIVSATLKGISALRAPFSFRLPYGRVRSPIRGRAFSFSSSVNDFHTGAEADVRVRVRRRRVSVQRER